MAHIELTGSMWSNGKYIELGHPSGVIWEADFSRLPLSTASNAAMLRTELANRGLTLTRASAATVQTSASAVVTSGIGVDDPRVGDGGYGRALVIEEARQNVLPVSETIDTWNVTGTASSSANTIVAPDGATTAEAINTPASGDGYWRGGTVGAGYRTRSIWVQSSSGAGDANLTEAGYALADTAITTGAAWVRGSSTDTNAAAAGSVWIRKRTSTSFRTWGGQVEAGRFATEYIPTTGAAATRAAETLTMATAARIVRDGRVRLEYEYVPKHSTADMNSGGNILFAQASNNRCYWNSSGTWNSDGGTLVTSTNTFTWAAFDVLNVFVEYGNGVPYIAARKNGGARTVLSFTAGSNSAVNPAALAYLMNQTGTIAPCSAWLQRVRAYAPGFRPGWAR